MSFNISDKPAEKHEKNNVELQVLHGSDPVDQRKVQ